jgi:hypothetical protein
MSEVSGVIPYAFPVVKNILQKCHNLLEITGKTRERIRNEKNFGEEIGIQHLLSSKRNN